MKKPLLLGIFLGIILSIIVQVPLYFYFDLKQDLDYAKGDVEYYKELTSDLLDTGKFVKFSEHIEEGYYTTHLDYKNISFNFEKRTDDGWYSISFTDDNNTNYLLSYWKNSSILNYSEFSFSIWYYGREECEGGKVQ